MLKKTILLLFFVFAVFYLRWDVQRPDSQIPKEKKEFRLLLLHRNGVGEKESCARIKTACENLGWECYIRSSRPTTLQKLFHPFAKTIQAVNPDLTINFQSAVKYAPGVNFVSLSSSFAQYTDFQKYTSFDALLPTFQETDLLKEKIEALGKPYLGMRWFFTCPATPFTPPSLARLFYCGSNWDQTRKAEAYKQLFARLDETGDLSIYGPPKAWKHTPRSYRGFLPFDGISTLKTMRECGIVLILHSETHLKGGTPTARIFEAAASGCVIISDHHPFVMQEFGDSILYIDQEASPELLFQQIEDHLAWIRTHPKEAQENALRSHQTFLKRFTLEQQLLELHSIYEKIPQAS